MNDAIPATTHGNRLGRFRRIVSSAAWAVAGLLLLVGSTDARKTYFLMWPVWLALAPWVWPRLRFIGRGIFYGYTAALCGLYAADLHFEFYALDRENYFHTLLFGSLAGLIVAVSRHGLGPDSPVGERILRTALMTLALIGLLFCCSGAFLPAVR